MELEKQIESAITAVLNSSVFTTTPYLRAFLVDDSPDATDEEIVYPVIQILCGTAQPYAEEEILYVAEVTLMVATNLLNDAKRQVLSSIYGTCKQVLTAEAINAALPDWINLLGAEVQDGAPDLAGNEQSENFSLKVSFAADEDAALTTTTTTTGG